jgi:hypothetical protein
LLQGYRKSALSAFGDVENALTAVKETRAQHDAEVQTLRSARRSYQMALEAFHGGTTTILNVFTAEEAVTTAEDGESQSHIAYMHALISLFQALGGGWTKPVETAQAPAATSHRRGVRDAPVTPPRAGELEALLLGSRRAGQQPPPRSELKWCGRRSAVPIPECGSRHA